jgi:hypothetical protein
MASPPRKPPHRPPRSRVPKQLRLEAARRSRRDLNATRRDKARQETTHPVRIHLLILIFAIPPHFILGLNQGQSSPPDSGEENSRWLRFRTRSELGTNRFAFNRHRRQSRRKSYATISPYKPKITTARQLEVMI